MRSSDATTDRHTRFDDAQAPLGGTRFISLGVSMLIRVGLLTGGTAGLVFLVTTSPVSASASSSS